VRSRGASSVRLFEGPDGLAVPGDLTPLPLGWAEPEVVTSYKDAMAQILVSFPEWSIVQAIVERGENQILDQEVTLQEPGQPRLKVDLVHYDATLEKLAFVEVKRVNDPRLFSRSGRATVLDQLAGYGQRLVTLSGEIASAYRDVVRLKRELGLGDRLSDVPSDGSFDVLPRPVLVIGGCTAADVERIEGWSDEWVPLLAELPQVAAGIVLCGSGGCRLTLAKGRRQTHVF